MFIELPGAWVDTPLLVGQKKDFTVVDLVEHAQPSDPGGMLIQ